MGAALPWVQLSWVCSRSRDRPGGRTPEGQRQKRAGSPGLPLRWRKMRSIANLRGHGALRHRHQEIASESGHCRCASGRYAAGRRRQRGVRDGRQRRRLVPVLGRFGAAYSCAGGIPGSLGCGFLYDLFQGHRAGCLALPSDRVFAAGGAMPAIVTAAAGFLLSWDRVLAGNTSPSNEESA